MAMQDFKYKDVNGNVQTAAFDTDYGLRPELTSDEQEWKVVASDPVDEETTEFIGRMPKK